MTPDTFAAILADLPGGHGPSEHIDWVAVPPVTEMVCLLCQQGDGYQLWPCDAGRVLAAVNLAPLLLDLWRAAEGYYDNPSLSGSHRKALHAALTALEAAT